MSNESTPDYPIGGMVERYDIERDEKDKDEKKAVGPIVYCPECQSYCGDVYCGMLYKFGHANLDGKCPYCGHDLKELIKERENF